jgi:hypothetical protein
MQCSKTALLFDHVVCALLENPRNIEAERLGGVEIDHQLVFYRGLHRQVGRLLAPEDAVGVASGAPKIIEGVVAIGEQASEFSIKPVRRSLSPALAGLSLD